MQQKEKEKEALANQSKLDNDKKRKGPGDRNLSVNFIRNNAATLKRKLHGN